jgi:outer membrane receptor protein involved in Fe transport
MLKIRKIKSRAVVTNLIGVAMLFCFSLTAQAQTATGGLRGVVTDASDAALPGAAVVAKNVATGLEIKTTTTGEGFYSIPRILPGKYSVTIEARGFKKAEVTEVDVSVGKDTVVDAKLEAGAISEVVTVTGGAEALVEKDSVQISTTFQQKKVQELPVNIPGRGLDRIALLTPGVTVGFGNVNGNGVTISANGQRARSNNFTIDGVDNNDLSIGGPNYFVRNADIVQEFQVITNNYSAEYGRNQGAIVNIVSRSGTNSFHGGVSWDHLDQKNFDSLTNIERRNAVQTRKETLNPAPSLDNIFGYTIGGPVIKNKIFFFTSGNFRRNPLLADLRATTLSPTPAGVAALKAAFPNNAAVQYYADYSAFSLPIGNPVIRPDFLAANPTLPTITVGTTVVPMAQVQRLVPRVNKANEYTFRGDGNLTDKHRLWGRYFWQDQPGIDALIGVDGFSGDQPAQSKQLGGGWNWTISSRINNEFRFNYSKLFVLFGGGTTGGKGQIPHPDEIDLALANFVPNFNASNGTALLAVGPATNLPQGRSVEAFQYTDNLTLTYGNHQLKTGFDLRKLENTAPFLPFVNGQFVFNTPALLGANTPTNTNVAFGPATLVYGEYDKFTYFQDDWRIKPNLTLNLGVRYEHTGQPINLLNDVTVARESNNSQAFWRQNLPIEARTNPRIPVDTNNWAPRIGFVYAPRFESGWMGKLLGKDKTTVRGGFGVAYDATFYNLMLNISTASPTVFLTSAVLPVPNAAPTGDKVRGAAQSSGLIRFNTFDPRFNNRTTINSQMRSPYAQQWSLGFQRELFGRNVFEARYVGSHGVGQFQTINANPFIGNLVRGFSRPFHDPVSNSAQTMSFPGFPNALGVSVTPQNCPDLPETADNESICDGRVFRSGLARERINGAQNIYHSLQMRYDGRFRNQWLYGFTYTFSKNLDNASEVFNFAGGNSVTVSQNPLQLTGIERSYAGTDVPHSFTANFIWTLPFMSGQKGVLGRVVGGWQLNGTMRVQNGIRWTPTQLLGRNPYEDGAYMNAFIAAISHFRAFAGNPNAPKNSVAISDVDACIFYSFCGAQGGNPILLRSSTGYYKMSDLNLATRTFTPVSPNDVRFIINGPGSAARFGTPFGTLSRNTEQGDRIETVDMSVFKTFRVTERVNIQYRLQMINALNHPIFALNTANNFIGTPASISVDNRLFYNFQENSGGRRVISMSLRVQF